MIFIASLLGAQHKRDNSGEQTDSLLDVSLNGTLDRMPTSLCGKQVAGPSSLPIVVAQSYRRLTKSSNEKRIIRGAFPKIKDLVHRKKQKFVFDNVKCLRSTLMLLNLAFEAPPFHLHVTKLFCQ